MNRSASRIALLSAATCLICTSALAANPPPPPVTPGQVQSTLPTQQAAPNPSTSGTITQPGPTPSGVAPGGPSITVQGFDISGNSAIPTSTLQAQVASYIGKTLTLAELYDVADVLTRYYRAQGYGLAYVSLPAQTLNGGTVKLSVIEGRIGKITIQGNDRTKTAVFEKRAAGMHTGDVYTDAVSERAVLLMNDLPGTEVHAVLSPGADYGTSDVLYNVKETHSSADASIDDYGRTIIGRWRVSADYYLNSMTGNGDQLTAGITHSDGNRLNFGKLSYALPVGPTGGTLTSSYNRAEYHGDFVAIGTHGTGIPFGGSTQNAAVTWQYPELRSSSRNLYLTAGLAWDNSRSKTYDATTGVITTETLTTNLMLLQLSGFYNRVYDNQSSLTLNGNLWTNGKHYVNAGTSLAADVNQSAERLRMELDTTYQKPFANVWSFTAQVNATYSVNPLTDADKYNLGGPGSVMGYQSAEQRGDSGYFASGEVLRGFALSPNWPMAGGVFVDTGTVWDKNDPAAKAAAITAGTRYEPERSLSSTGLDVKLFPGLTKLNASLQWAWSIGRHPTDGGNGGHIWLSVGMTF